VRFDLYNILKVFFIVFLSSLSSCTDKITTHKVNHIISVEGTVQFAKKLDHSNPKNRQTIEAFLTENYKGLLNRKDCHLIVKTQKIKRQGNKMIAPKELLVKYYLRQNENETSIHLFDDLDKKIQSFESVKALSEYMINQSKQFSKKIDVSN